ncbi:MAG: SET domain-containing protein-lysine N-methyltransferase [Rhodospirillales bacterium]|nr:SET domain-containing protein-lysine N-methyltransferase [Rhodospirillales bacterium]MCB9995803.1 SET domain-containing protein-lysine N-methyltransferase [Rhodospirillales bacterium]
MEAVQDNVYSFDTALQEQQEALPQKPGVEGCLDGAIGWDRINGKYRGVIARRNIAKGEVIERAPVVPVPKANMPEEGPPDGYVLEWRDDIEGEEYALVLGYVMLYNHSENPNIHMDSDFANETIEVIAMRDIEAGEELTWNYNCEIWFDMA